MTKTASDEYVFRAAPLRNVALRAPYFHSGQVWSLKQAVGVMGAAQLWAKLTDKEEDDIVAFLWHVDRATAEDRISRSSLCAPTRHQSRRWLSEMTNAARGVPHRFGGRHTTEQRAASDRPDVVTGA